MFPKVPLTANTERRGVNLVAKQLADLGVIWRETSNDDIGIDGQIEYVDEDGCATGIIAGVQIKAGSSYFGLKDGGTIWKYYPSQEHKNYWEVYPIPVILILCNLETSQCFWVDARQYLRSLVAGDFTTYISIPKINILKSTSPFTLFESECVAFKQLHNMNELMFRMMSCSCPVHEFNITYFTLFINSLINTCRQIYFDISHAISIAEYSVIDQSQSDIIINNDVHDFLFSYVSFLKGQKIADINFSDCYTDYYIQHLLPRFIAPLTSKGHKLVEHIRDKEKVILSNKKLYPDVALAQENLISLQFDMYSAQRTIKANMFQKMYKQSMLSG